MMYGLAAMAVGGLIIYDAHLDGNHIENVLGKLVCIGIGLFIGSLL
ncbi:hypothetical protein VPHK469_0098 [Vibrio phage K469]